jgi:hypothetical protein
MSDFTMKVGDTLPELLVTLKDGAGSAIDVSGSSSITFRMRKSDAAVGVYAVNRAAEFNTSGSDGKVKIALTADETAIAGVFQGEFVIDWGGGDQQTVPSISYVMVEVQPKA